MSKVTESIGFLFDLDGVLIDTESKYTEIWHNINLKFPTGIADFEHVIKGTTLENILNTYFEKKDHSDVVKMLYEQESSMKYEYCPGAFELLGRLKQQNIPTALVTSSNEMKLSFLYSQLPGLASFFDVVIDGDKVKHSKPNPEGYLLGAEKLNVSPSRCVVFEDSLQGVMAGRAAGAYVIGMAGTLPAEIIRPYSDIVTDTLEELDADAIVDILRNR